MKQALDTIDMTDEQKRTWLHDAIDRIDEALLFRLVEIVKKDQRTEEERAELVRQYEASLVPMSHEEMERRLEKAREDIAAGRTYTLQQVKRMLGR